MTTSSTIKPKQKRLDRSIHTGVDQTNIRINIAAETGNRAQFARQMPVSKNAGSTRLDWGGNQWQKAEEGIPLGEYRLNGHTVGFVGFVGNLGLGAHDALDFWV